MQTQEQEIQQKILQILLDFNKRGIDQIPVAMIMLLLGVDENKIPKWSYNEAIEINTDRIGTIKLLIEQLGATIH